MDYIDAGQTNVSVIFALDDASIAVTAFKISYTRFDVGDGTSFAKTGPTALTALASITTAHTDNYGIYLSSTADDAAKFQFRADFPDAAFANGADRVVCSIFDDTSGTVAHRIFNLKENYDRMRAFVSQSIANISNDEGEAEGSLYAQFFPVIKQDIEEAVGQESNVFGNDSGEKLGLVEDGAEVGVFFTHGRGNVDDDDARVGQEFLGSVLTYDADVGADGAFMQIIGGYYVSTVPTANNIATMVIERQFGVCEGFTNLDVFANGNAPTTPGKWTQVDNTGEEDRVKKGWTFVVKLTQEYDGSTYIVDHSGEDMIIRSAPGMSLGNGYAHSIINRYSDGFVYFDGSASNTNQNLGVDGTSDNPVSDEATAIALAEALGTRKIMIQGSGTFQLSSGVTKFHFESSSNFLPTFEFNSNNPSSCSFKNMRIGDSQSSDGDNTYFDCSFASGITVIYGLAYRCKIEGTIEVGNLEMIDCFGNDVTFTRNIGESSNNQIWNFSCTTLTFDNCTTADETVVHLDGNPIVTINISCDDGTLILMGFAQEINDNNGGMTVTDQTNLDTIKNKDSNQNYDQTTDSLEALGDAVGNIAVSGSAVNQIADSNTITDGSEGTTDYTDTHELDGNYNEITDNAGTLDMYYEFDIGPTGVPVSSTIIGFLNGINDDLDIYAYDWNSTDWDQVGNIQGKPGSGNDTLVVDLFPKHVGTGGNQGLVRIRFYKASGLSSAQLNVDQIFASYAIVNQTIGYDDGAIWIDTNDSNTNTVPYVDGTADNPVSTWAAALTLNTTLGLNKFRIKNGSSIQLSGSSDNYTIDGNNWTLDLNGQSVSGAKIEGAEISGNDDGSNAAATIYRNCLMGDNTLGLHRLEECGLGGDLVLAEAGTIDWINCQSRVAGTDTPSVDFGAAVANTNLNMRDYSGGIEVKNMGQSGTDNMSLEGFGQLKINANCDPSGSPVIALRGHFKITDSVGGGFVAGGGTLSDDPNFVNPLEVTTTAYGPSLDFTNTQKQSIEARCVDALESLGLDGLIAVVGQADAAVPPAQGQTFLIDETNLGLTDQDDDYFNGMSIIFTSGVNAGLSTEILDYDKATAKVTFADVWPNTFLAGTDKYIIASKVIADNLPSIGAGLDLGDGTTITEMLTAIAGKTADAGSYNRATHSNEAIADGESAAHPDILQTTTIATLTSQTVFTLTAGSSDDNAYNGAMAVITDSATAEQKAVADISDYDGGTKEVTLLADPAIFTMAVGDEISIIAKKTAVNANIKYVNDEPNNDGVDWDVSLKKMQAILFGEINRTGDNYKFRDQGDTTDLVDYDVTLTGRTIN